MKRIAIFASGQGTNAQAIIDYFRDHSSVSVFLILSNKKTAPVTDRARKENIPVITFDRETFYQTDFLVQVLKDNRIDLVVLAGFMWLIPKNLTEAYSNKMINIHPALLPNYGGKGMYGMHVHNAIHENKEKETGITIHYVNEEYDKGAPILQKKCSIDPGKDNPETIAQKVHQLEYEHYPKAVEMVLNAQEE